MAAFEVTAAKYTMSSLPILPIFEDAVELEGVVSSLEQGQEGQKEIGLFI